MGYRLYLTIAPVAALFLAAAWLTLNKYKEEPPARSLQRFLGLVVLFIALNVMELLAKSKTLTTLFAKTEYAPLLLLPISFTWFCLRYTGHDRYVTARTRAALLGLAATIFAGIATNELHGLFWRSVDYPVVEGLLTMRPSYGPLFWLTAIYAWGGIAAGAYVVLRSYIMERGPYRTRSFAVVAGALLPGIFNAIYISRLVPGLRKDFTPLGFALGGLCFFAGTYLSRATRVIPLARGVALQELDEGVLFIDPAERLADYNGFAADLLGLSGASLGRPAASIPTLEPVFGLLADAARDGIATAQVSIAGRSIVAKSKRLGARQSRVAARGWVLTLVDISERARMQEELDAARADMLKREHFAVIGRLSADIAHEINNPLGYIWAEVRSIEASALPAIPNEHVRSQVSSMVEAVEDGLGRIETTVRNLLAYAKRGASEDEAPAPYDLARGVRSALELSRSDYGRLATVRVDIRDAPVVLARGSEIDRVFINILRNAAQALQEKTATGGGPGHIWISARVEGAFAVCEIGNDGAPIPEEEKDRVFQEFFSSKEEGKGTGLGLSISRDIVEKRHGGRLYLASLDPVVFAMELPLADSSFPSQPGLV